MASSTAEIILKIRDAATGALRSIQQALGGVAANADRAGKEMAGANAAIGKTRDYAKELLNVELAKWFFEIAKGAAAWFGEFLKLRQEQARMAESNRTTVESVKAIGIIASATGVQIGDMGKAIGAFKGREEELRPVVEMLRLFGVQDGPRAVEATKEWQKAVIILTAAWEGMKQAFFESSGSIAEGLVQIGVKVGTVAMYVNAITTNAWSLMKDTFAAALDEMQRRLSLFIAYARAVNEAYLAGDYVAAAKLTAGGVAAGNTLGRQGENRGRSIWEDSGMKKALDDSSRMSAEMTQRLEAALQGLDASLNQAADTISSSQGEAAKAATEAAARVDQSRQVSIDMSDLDQGVASELRTAVFKGVGQFFTGATALAWMQKVQPVASAAMGGNVGAAISAIPTPWTKLIGTALQFFQEVGERGADQIGENITNSVRTIIKGLEAMPRLVGEVLPMVGARLIPEIFQSLLKSFPALVSAHMKALPMVLNAWFRDVPYQLAGAVVKGFLSILDKIKEALSNPFQRDGEGNGRRNRQAAAFLLTGGLSEVFGSAFRGARDAGREARGFASGVRYVPEDGLYRLHRGERVSNASGASDGTTNPGRMGRGGGGVSVHIHGPVYGGEAGVRQLIREINRQLGPRGLRESMGG